MDTRSNHLIVDIWFDKLESDWVEKAKTVIRTHLTVLNESEHQFEPQGQTIAFILSESHFVLHTYPEEDYASLDIYVCNLGVDLDKILDELVRGSQIRKLKKDVLTRGVRS